MRMEMEMEDLEAALARADSSLQAASRKHQQVEEDLNNKVRRKEEVEREIAEKEQFWERYLRTLKVQVDGQKQCLNFLTKEVEQARRQSANISRFSTASGHLNIEDSDFATKPVDADRYNSLLIHARQVEALLKTFREEVMESPSEEENSLGSLLAAIEQEAERHNSPPRQSQEETDVEPTDPVHSSRLHDDVEGIDIFVDLVLDRGSQKVPVHTNVLQPERIPQTFSCADQQLPVDSEDSRPERIPPEVSSQENGCLPNEQMVEVITVDNVPVTSNTSPESLHGGPTAQARGQPSVVGRPPLQPSATSRGTVINIILFANALWFYGITILHIDISSIRRRFALEYLHVTFFRAQSPGQPSGVARPPLVPAVASRRTARGQPSVVGRPPLPPAAANRGTARGQPSVVGRPPRPPAAASRGTARGRGRAGQTTARQVIGRGSSRGTKRSADGVVVPFADARGEPVSKQARQDDDDTDIWADFAEYQAQAAANSKTKKWEAWLREAFMTETERAERMLRMIAEDKAQWDAIVATFPYGARNQFDNRVGYDFPDFVPIPKDPPEPPRPRTPPHVQIERIRAEYTDGTRDRSLGYQPICEHGLAWEDCPLCRRKPWPPMRCWTDEDLIAIAAKAQFYHDWNGRLAAEKRAKHIERRKHIRRIIWNYENRHRRQIITVIEALKNSLETESIPRIGETSTSNKDSSNIYSVGS
ncbi:hypothetical protein R1sor_012305 [Riccia sorocarpa]|uniref:Uncharacterized protein n=1 Tax=Riccia sorocarpa TaxID=122646 RepID=A0ABD3I586_9MARC